jgi:hypothetical protein
MNPWMVIVTMGDRESWQCGLKTWALKQFWGGQADMQGLYERPGNGKQLEDGILWSQE